MVELFSPDSTSVKPRPALGPNPFACESDEPVHLVVNLGKPNHSPAFRGTVTFCSRDNNGHFWLGKDDRAFKTKWLTENAGCIHLYDDLQEANFSAFEVIEPGDAEVLNENGIAVLQNCHGYFMAIQAQKFSIRTRRGRQA